MRKITLLFLCLIPAIALSQPGAIDFGFNTGTGPDTSVFATATQPDGKILIAGTFDNYNGTLRSGIARLNADGSLDSSFDPGAGLALSTEYIYCLTLQSDGKILIGGIFANFNGTPRGNIARLNTDGSVDTSFNPGTGTNNEVVTISLQSTGKIIIGGLFTTYNSLTRNWLARLNADGTLDTSFSIGTGTNSYVWTTSVLSDDRIYIGGGFSMFNGSDANHLLRLNANGSRDTSYTPFRFTSNSVLTHAVQPDGKIIIGGYFTNYNGAPRNRLARINFDGTLDTTFNVGTGLNNYPLTLVCQPNGKILVGGSFTQYNSATANRIVRLNSDGTTDASFLSGTGMNGQMYMATFQPDGKILLVGEATTYNGDATKPNLVKVNGYSANAIAVASLSGASPFCIGQGFTVNYTADGYYAVGNTFTAQLSDASGSFASPVAIGSANATASGTIPVVIPPGTAAGNGYRIRVVGSNLPTIGTDNGSDLQITTPVTYYQDADADGYGNPAVAQLACTPPVGYVVNNTDCNDAQPNANPGFSEVLYDGIDNNCDGQLDEGFRLTTQLLPASCGTTLAAMGSLIQIQTIAPASAITRWRIRATNGAQVQTIETAVPHFTMPQFASYAYATTYTVEIELQRNGTWLGYYGAPCLVSTPAILQNGGAGAINPSQCGTVLTQINTLIATTSLAGVTGYRFQITNLTDPLGPNAVQTLDRTQNWFTLQMLARYNYGTTYKVEVAVKTTGTYAGFGASCEIASPAVPSLINCGGTVASVNALVKAASVAGAVQYRFQVTRQSDNAFATIDSNTNYFAFNMVPSAVFMAGAAYSVRVAVLTNGTWSPFSATCAITAPGGLGKGIADMQTAISSEFRVMATPNPFTSDFGIGLLSSSAEKFQVKVYDMLGRLVECKEMQLPDEAKELGTDYPSGVYNVVVKQGEMVKTLRVIKR